MADKILRFDRGYLSMRYELPPTLLPPIHWNCRCVVSFDVGIEPGVSVTWAMVGGVPAVVDVKGQPLANRLPPAIQINRRN